MRDYTILLKLEKQRMTNKVKAILTNPKRLIFYILYILLMTFVFFNNTRNLNGDKTAAEMARLQQYVGAGVFLFIALMSHSMLKRSSLFFQMSEVNLLFQAPIDSRKILMINLLKKIPTYLLTALFTLIFVMSMIIKVFHPSTSAIVISTLSYTMVYLILEPLSFCLFVISTKLKKETFRKTAMQIISYIIAGMIILSLVSSVKAHGISINSLLVGFNNSSLNWIPILGWGRFLVLTVTDGITSYTYLALGAMIFLYLITVLTTFYLGDDYYEDVLAFSEERQELVARARAGQKVGKRFVLKNKRIQLKDNRRYASALYWKRKLEINRRDISTYFSLETILCVAVILLIDLFGKMNTLYTPYAVAGGYFYIKFLFSAINEGDSELKKHFIYLIPDKAMNKIVAMHRLDLIRFIINIVVMLLAHVILTGETAAAYIVLPFTLIFVNTLMIFSSYLINIFIGGEDFQRLIVLFKMLQTILLLVPSVIVLIWIGATTNNVFMALLGSAAINMLITVVILALSDIVFERLELK